MSTNNSVRKCAIKLFCCIQICPGNQNVSQVLQLIQLKEHKNCLHNFPALKHCGSSELFCFGLIEQHCCRAESKNVKTFSVLLRRDFLLFHPYNPLQPLGTQAFYKLIEKIFYKILDMKSCLFNICCRRFKTSLWESDELKAIAQFLLRPELTNINKRTLKRSFMNDHREFSSSENLHWNKNLHFQHFW